MKKQLINIIVLSALIFTINTANANAPTSKLKVIGTLTVPSCTVIAPNDGVYDIGKLSSSLVKAGIVMTSLTSMTKTWTVNCDADTYLNFIPIDNRAASASIVSPAAFGLGYVNGTGKIGYYTARMKNAIVDGKASSVFTTNNSSFTAAYTTDLINGMRTGWSFANNLQSTGKVFTADIVVVPVLAGTTTMRGPLTDDAKIDGSLTMNFAFGI